MDNKPDNKSKSFLDDVAGSKPESFQEEVFTKQKRNYVPVIIFAVLGVILIGVIVFFSTKGVTVPDMANWKEQEVYAWVNTNKMTIVKNIEYSMEVEEGILMKQNPAANSSLPKGGTLTVTISGGADPNEKLAFPENIKEMALDQINDWIKQNKISSINIKEENNSVFPKGNVISVDFVDGSADNYLRKNRVNILVSKGPKESQDTVTVPDFAGKSKAEVARWADTNKIEVSYSEAFNEFIEEGKVTSQNILANSRIKSTDKLEIELSLGSPIIVPNFVGMKQNEVIEMAKIKGLQVYTKTEISAREPGIVLAQDVEAGSTISKSKLITLTVSMESDSVKVPQFVGLTQTEASSLAGIYNVKTFFVTKESTKKSGTVIEQSISSGTTIKKETLVTIYVSAGDVKIPNFIGLTKESATAIGEADGIVIVYKEVPTIGHKKDTIIAQSYKVGEVLPNTTKIILSVATNNGVVVPDFSAMSKTEVELWATINKTEVKIIDLYSDIIPAGKFFKQNYINTYAKGTEPVVVYHSLGRIPVTNFVGQTKLEIATWLNDINTKGGNVKINYLESSNSSKSAGTVVRQSISSDLVSVGTSIDVWIAVNNVNNTIPSLAGLTEKKIGEWCTENNISFKIVEKYSDSALKGTIFGQNYANQPMPAGETLLIYKSLGKLYIPSFMDKPKAEVETWLNDTNIKGGNITVNYVVNDTSKKTAGTVLRQSLSQNFINVGSVVEIEIASPHNVDVPNVVGKSLSEAVSQFDQRNIQYEVVYIYINEENAKKYPPDTVVSQSTTGRTSYTDIVKLTVSKGKKL